MGYSVLVNVIHGIGNGVSHALSNLHRRVIRQCSKTTWSSENTQDKHWRISHTYSGYSFPILKVRLTTKMPANCLYIYPANELVVISIFLHEINAVLDK